MAKPTLSALALFGLLLLASCRDGPDDAVIAELLREYDAGALGPITEIWMYRYNDQVVYYLPPKCCDIPSLLLDAKGDPLCSPDGGLTGAGDGKCPDFFDVRRGGKLVWSAQDGGSAK